MGILTEQTVLKIRSGNNQQIHEERFNIPSMAAQSGVYE
jgi:hypothetical protein